MVLVKLGVDLVDVAIDCHCIGGQVVQVVTEDLHGGNRIDGGEACDDLAHERGVFNVAESVLLKIGEETTLSVSSESVSQAGNHHGVVLLGPSLPVSTSR